MAMEKGGKHIYGSELAFTPTSFCDGKNISITTSWDNDPNKHPIMDHILEFFKNISYVHVLICIFID